ncbi:MAG: Na/Pi cotransporter family protein [Oscillospiraceae bacterium]|jgi:phosphate:Na+ symporter|nr:Na/Pi cotransporter family protein [Oscillospiraceae bacterium]
MDIFGVITLLGGVALFLFGMNIMGEGLEKISGGRLERILDRLTSNQLKAILLGTAVTAVIQSSSATTVMLVGFVNAGIMKLSQVVGVIMGANIGTTVTAWIISLGDIGSANTVLQFFKPVTLAPFAAIGGIVLTMAFKRGKRNDTGRIMLGFGILFFGMLTMETVLKGLAEVEGFKEMMTAFSNPFLGVLVGAGLTAVIQSSSASVGILQALCASAAAAGNPVLFKAAAPIIMGQNIGTCVTALLASIGTNRNAKRTALIHLFFNVFGTVIFLTVLYGLNALIRWPFWETGMSRSSIAVFHTTFKVITTVLLLPCSDLLIKLSKIALPGESGEREIDGMLVDSFLTQPAFALSRAHEAVLLMAGYAEKNYSRSVDILLNQYDEKRFFRFREDENNLDKLEVHINQYLLKLTGRGLTREENLLHSELLHAVGDIERIGDLSDNIAEAAQERTAQGVHFTGTAKDELRLLANAVSELISITFQAYKKADVQGASKIEPLEETIDRLTEILRSRHIERLKSDGCGIEASALYLELLINFERIADHCSNIGLYTIQRGLSEDRRGKFDMHAYVRHLHAGQVAPYNDGLIEYERKYLAALDAVT